MRGVLAEGAKFLMLSPELEMDKLTRLSHSKIGFTINFNFYTFIDKTSDGYQKLRRELRTERYIFSKDNIF